MRVGMQRAGVGAWGNGGGAVRAEVRGRRECGLEKEGNQDQFACEKKEKSTRGKNSRPAYSAIQNT